VIDIGRRALLCGTKISEILGDPIAGKMVNKVSP